MAVTMTTGGRTETRRFIGKQGAREMVSEALASIERAGHSPVQTPDELAAADARIEAACHVKRNGQFINFWKRSDYAMLMGVVDLRTVKSGDGITTLAWDEFTADDLEAYCSRRLQRAFCDRVREADRAERQAAVAGFDCESVIWAMADGQGA